MYISSFLLDFFSAFFLLQFSLHQLNRIHCSLNSVIFLWICIMGLCNSHASSNLMESKPVQYSRFLRAFISVVLVSVNINMLLNINMNLVKLLVLYFNSNSDISLHRESVWKSRCLFCVLQGNAYMPLRSGTTPSQLITDAMNFTNFLIIYIIFIVDE